MTRLDARPARRTRTMPAPTRKESPMSTYSPHAPGQVVEETAEEREQREQRAAAQQAAAPPEFPAALWPWITTCEGVFAVPNPVAVRRQRVLDLARVVLDYPERDRVALIAELLHRAYLRAAPGASR